MRIVTAEDLALLLPRADLCAALDAAFRSDVANPERHRHHVPVAGQEPNLLLLMPAWIAGDHVGVKVVMLCPRNAQRDRPVIQASYLLMDATTGQPLALLDGTELTLRRTAATSALAASYLARSDSSKLLIVGTGALAPHLALAHRAMLPIEAVRIWGRSPVKAAAVAAHLREAGVHDARVASSLEESCRWADLISCATSSTTALVRGSWLRPGQHLDLVGSHTPQMREVDDEAVRRSRIFVDTRAGALQEAGDLIAPIEAGVIDAADVIAELAELARGDKAGRGKADEITLFKSVGAALEDLAAASLAFEKAGVAID